MGYAEKLSERKLIRQNMGEIPELLLKKKHKKELRRRTRHLQNRTKKEEI